ncbi:MAG: hypothetical protein WD712_00850 [Candidatus Spechtbacterales bacterium]
MFRHLWREAAIILLAILGLVLAVSAAFSIMFGESGPHSVYNDGVALLEKQEIEKAQERFAEAIISASDEPDISVSAKYNLALAMLYRDDLDSDALFQIRNILEEALRGSPQDTDIRKNLELVQNLLLETLQKELAKRGENPEDAQQMIDEFYEQYPGDGEKPGRNEGNERSY